MKFNKICMIGLGYIGLPIASKFAVSVVKVVGVDVYQGIVRSLSSGGLHIHKPFSRDQRADGQKKPVLCTCQSL